MKDFFRKMSRKLNPWYTLEVMYQGRERRFIVTKFNKKSPKHLSGYNIDNEWFELRSNTPMDYYIEEYTGDLK